MIHLCDFQEALDPFSATDNALLIKYKECTLDILVFVNVVPRVDDNRVLKRVILWICGHTEVS